MKTNILICKNKLILAFLIFYITVPIFSTLAQINQQTGIDTSTKDSKTRKYVQAKFRKSGKVNSIDYSMVNSKILDAVINMDKHNTLTSFSNHAYQLKDGEAFIYPLKIEPTIDIPQFLSFLQTAEGVGYNSITIYPGIVDKKLFMILALSKSNGNESNYALMNNYIYNNWPPDMKEKVVAYPYFKDYKSKVYIFDDETFDIRKARSRKYNIDTLQSYIISNIPSSSQNQIGYKLKLETGFVPDFLVEDFNRDTPVNPPESHIGFTVVFHIIDSLGSPVIDPFTVEAGYKNRHLEVGHPCPPVCGDLNTAPSSSTTLEQIKKD